MWMKEVEDEYVIEKCNEDSDDSEKTVGLVNG